MTKANTNIKEEVKEILNCDSKVTGKSGDGMEDFMYLSKTNSQH